MKKRSLAVAATAVLASFAALAGSSASAVAVSTPGATTPTQQLTSTNSAVPVKGDFDGDGRDDIFWYVEGSGTDYLWSGKVQDNTSAATTADRFDVTTIAITGSYTPIVGDFNGDGRDDILWYSPGPGADSIWYFTGRGTVNGVAVSIGGTYKAVVSDFDATDGLGADDIFWYNNSSSYLWTSTAVAGTFTSTAIMDPPDNAKVYKGNWRQTAVTVGAPEYEDLFFYAAGTAPDAIWAGNGDGGFTKTSITVNGTYDPIVGNFDSNASGVDMTDVFWYGPGAAADFVWMNNGSSFTSQATTVNGRYSPVVIPTREDTTQDDIFWNSQTAGDYLWATNGTNGTFAYSSLTPSAWGGSDIGTRSAIPGDFNIADRSTGGSAEASLNISGGNSCAVSTAGAVSCWGSQQWIFVNGNTSATYNVPTAIPGLTSGVAQVAVGIGFACARTTAGAVKCWGFNGVGSLGNGSTTNSATPVQVSGLTSGVKWISAGNVSACAVLADDTVKCWGGNFSGQLGNGSTTSSNIPVTATGVTGAAKVEIDDSMGAVCATLIAGGAKCWGLNAYGQLGTGATSSAVLTPTTATLYAGAVDVNVGSDFSCARFSTGAVKCIGRNANYQLGNGSTSDSTNIAVTPTGLSSGVVDLEVGNSHACAEMSTGQVKCWGANFSGQLGNGTGSNGQTPTNVTGLSSGVETISAGNDHTCVLLTGGSAKCFGNGTMGQLGNNTTSNASTPSTVSGSTVWSTGAANPTGNADVLWWTAGNATGETEVMWYDLDSLN